MARRTTAGSAIGFLDNLMDEVAEHDKWLAEKFGYFPLVSVRSGAPVSMPGMMDTILNVGLTDASLPEWAERIGEKAALDSYRRLIQMLGATAYGIDHDVFEFQLAKAKKEAGIAHDHELSVRAAGEAGEGLQMGVQGSDRACASRRTARSSCGRR